MIKNQQYLDRCISHYLYPKYGLKQKELRNEILYIILTFAENLNKDP